MDESINLNVTLILSNIAVRNKHNLESIELKTSRLSVSVVFFNMR